MSACDMIMSFAACMCVHMQMNVSECALLGSQMNYSLFTVGEAFRFPGVARRRRPHLLLASPFLPFFSPPYLFTILSQSHFIPASPPCWRCQFQREAPVQHNSDVAEIYQFRWFSIIAGKQCSGGKTLVMRNTTGIYQHVLSGRVGLDAYSALNELASLH